MYDVRFIFEQALDCLKQVENLQKKWVNAQWLIKLTMAHKKNLLTLLKAKINEAKHNP